jgi:hypothetical protein
VRRPSVVLGTPGCGADRTASRFTAADADGEAAAEAKGEAAPR